MGDWWEKLWGWGRTEILRAKLSKCYWYTQSVKCHE